METQANRSIHPLFLTAGIAVILFCAVGIAAVMGWIPTSVGKSGEVAAPALPDKVSRAPASGVSDGTAAARPQSKPVAKTASKPTQVAGNASTAARNAPAANSPAPAPVQMSAAPKCTECGVVESVREVETQGQASGLGAVGGAVAGGVLGNQVGGGRGKDVMTVVGAVGGALAGHQIEKKVKSTKSYEITVRFENGSTRVFTEANAPAWRQGDKVRIVNDRIQPNA
ncbi:MAG: glycine zipper 2TM domain-containing protein [Betaproteobacteria bacterium]|nr:glycine zipper 2TM domain-containing protein [Betaproteobacteria bacterium]